MFLANSFKESKAVLAQALLSKNQTKLLLTRASEASSPISSLDDGVLRMKSRLTEVQSGMDSRSTEYYRLSTCRSTTKYGSIFGRCNCSTR